ncbi:OmpA family protein [Phenylobacterium sp. J367]|uniref:OmpA family protein n=1 Tax=Phenylobacterium sp. J367 TaxID=2898435 RepID=UPI002151DDD8|nr:OmpA family protein [Phenylobacterium sp. J367]MCR5877790.1 OmpA family protein [Phenylobacterium sp. J367]
MSFKTSAAAAVLLVGLGLSACETVSSARDRLVRAPDRCVDRTVQIYFEPNQAEVTDEGRAVIKQAADDARGCKVGKVEVTGLADAVGAPADNLELSKRRAQSVTAALAAAGLPAAEFAVAAVGAAGAETADGRAAPLRRRADVKLHISR